MPQYLHRTQDSSVKHSVKVFEEDWCWHTACLRLTWFTHPVPIGDSEQMNSICGLQSSKLVLHGADSLYIKLAEHSVI